MSSDTITPEVVWAQRSSSADAEKNYIHMTINVPDVDPKGLKLDMQPSQITFTGTSHTHGDKTYHFELPLYAEIDPSASSINHTQHSIRMKLQKKEMKEEFWPRLQKSSQRLHYVKTDFDRWVDEDEQDEAPEDDFSQFGGMGGMPGGGMPGMGGMGGMPGMEGMGGMPGMGGMGGMPGMGGMGGMPGMEGIDFSKLAGANAEDFGDDDDMPELEGEEEVKGKTETKA